MISHLLSVLITPDGLTVWGSRRRCPRSSIPFNLILAYQSRGPNSYGKATPRRSRGALRLTHGFRRKFFTATALIVLIVSAVNS